METNESQPIKVGDIVRRTYLYDNSKEKTGIVVSRAKHIDPNLIFWIVLWSEDEKEGLVSEYEIEVICD